MAGRSAAEAQALVGALERDYHAATLTAADRAMLDYVAKLTLSPAAMVAGDVAGLRDAGFDERAVHDICLITAYYAFVNRVADGLGVDLEDRFGSG